MKTLRSSKGTAFRTFARASIAASRGSDLGSSLPINAINSSSNCSTGAGINRVWVGTEACKPLLLLPMGVGVVAGLLLLLLVLLLLLAEVLLLEVVAEVVAVAPLLLLLLVLTLVVTPLVLALLLLLLLLVSLVKPLATSPRTVSANNASGPMWGLPPVELALMASGQNSS